MADDMEYLQPSFDPSSVTVPKLRNILMTHDIRYPASAKKPELIDTFNEKLKPKARKLLAARDRVRRTSEGITHVPSSQGSSTEGDADGRDSMPPPPVPETRNRKSRTARRASPEESTPKPTSQRSTPSKSRSTSKQTGQSDSEQEHEALRQPTTESRRSGDTSSRRPQKSSDALRRPKLPESAFSDENPFQSGSSPLAPDEYRRRTLGSSGERPRSPSNRRKTDGAALISDRQHYQHEEAVPSSKSFEVPVSRLGKLQSQNTEDADEIQPGEEFTEEEQQDLVKAESKGILKNRRPPKFKRNGQMSGGVPKSLPWMFLITILGGYATWYRQEKLAVGYCGLGTPTRAVSDVQIPELVDLLRPTCEPCPQHAICSQNLETTCEADFIKKPHPLALGGLVPLPPTCEPDGEKARKVKAVADRTLNKLRERNAQAECGTLKDAEGKLLSADVTAQSLKEQIGKQRRRGMSDAEFEDLWKGAFDELVGREEIVRTVESADGVRLRSTSLARLPFGCSIKRSARLTLARYRILVSCLSFFLLLLAYVRKRILQSRADAARVPGLVATALDRLATQSALYSRGDAIESWISVGQLRDDVLRDEFSDSRRQSMWGRVREIVERNANVRASSRELRGGDVSRVWEWIGSVGLIDDPGFSGRKSGYGKRVSFGGVTEEGESPNRRPSPLNDEVATKDQAGVTQQRQWDEGRPIY